MKLILSWILCVLGDLTSRLARFGFFGYFLYPVYNHLMMWSIDLDKKGKIWKYVENEENK